MKVIIYLDNGTLRIVRPTPEGIAAFGVDGVAKKDVPTGVNYKIIDHSELPESREDRGAWSATESDMDSGVGE